MITCEQQSKIKLSIYGIIHKHILQLENPLHQTQSKFRRQAPWLGNFCTCLALDVCTRITIVFKVGSIQKNMIAT